MNDVIEGLSVQCYNISVGGFYVITSCSEVTNMMYDALYGRQSIEKKRQYIR